MLETNPKEHAGADLLAAAIEYAYRGWRVLPLHEPDPTKELSCTCRDPQCKSPGKHPRIKGWLQKATTNPERIREWWQQWPTANVGIATGDGLIVVDIDPRNGGTNSLSELELENGILFTWTVKTGSGGKHFYLRVADEVRCQTNWRPGIDIKGDGGYVVAPPSKHVEGVYRVVRRDVVKPAPQWLLESPRTGPKRLLTGPKMSEDQLARLAAPGETPEEKVRWTREVVARIPNDRAFDDRNAWVGMGHAIKVSCGPDAEYEAFEIFEEFSSRWDGPSDLRETERVWESLGDPRASGGYRKLLRLARRHGYELPEDHPWHPSNELKWLEELADPKASGEPLPADAEELPTSPDPAETPGLEDVLDDVAGLEDLLDDSADLADLLDESDPPAGTDVEERPETEGQRGMKELVAPLPVDLRGLMSSLDREWTWEDIFGQVPRLHEAASRLHPRDRAIFEPIVLSKITEVARSFPVAERIWRSFAPVDQRAVEVIDGTTVIRAADPRDIELEQDYVVDALVPAGAVGEVIADYSMGKTWLLLALALCVAFAAPFFGRSVQEGPVVYLAYEGQRGLWKRSAGWLVEHGLLAEDFTLEELRDVLDGRLIVAEIPPRFDQAQIESLIRDTVEHYGAGLVIIDTRGKSLGGDLDENSADSANLVQGVLSAIARETGATIISAHHKPLGASNRGRGSSAWTQGADFAFRIDGTRDDFENGKPVKLKAIKFRDDQSPRPVSFRLRSPVEMTVDGTAWRSAVIEPVTPQQAIPQSVRALVFAEISREPGRGLDKIRKAVKGAGSTKIDQAIDELINSGAIEDRGNRRGRSYHPTGRWALDGLGDIRDVTNDFLSLTGPEGSEATQEDVLSAD